MGGSGTSYPSRHWLVARSNVVADLARYAGREQAYVKHYFLEVYLDALIHKLAGGYSHIVYIDGFSGPWQAIGENFEDTSFVIALNALRSAKAKWKELGRNVQMTAHLVEKSEAAFRKLARVPAQFPDVSVIPHHGDFVSIAASLARQIPVGAFVFLFVDPKGWRIDIAAIAPLFSRPNCEVVFNFMFDFINRAAPIRNPAGNYPPL